MKYVVINTNSHCVRYFETYQEANNFRVSRNSDWRVVGYIKCKPTRKQQGAIRWIENILRIKFTGQINSGEEVSKFLDEYLVLAKELYIEKICKNDRCY